MIPSLHTWPLRRNLILALAGILALALVLDRLYEFAWVRPAELEAQYSQELQQRSYTLSRDFSKMLLAGDMQALRIAVAERATDPLQRQMLVFDDQDKVIASSAEGGVGHVPADIDQLDLAAFHEARQSNRLVLRQDLSQRTVTSYSPVSLPNRPDELRSLRSGVLFIQLDLTPVMAANWQRLHSTQTLVRWLATLALAGLLMAWFIRRQIIAPLQHLEDVTRRLAEGDWQARSGLAGDGELAALGRVFNRMREYIMADRQQLHASEVRFRQMMDLLPLSVQIFAPDGRAIHVNRAWQSLWGATFDQLQGYVVFEDAQLRANGVLAGLRQAFAGQAVELPVMEYDKAQIPRLDLDGKIWLRAFAYPLLDAQGATVEVVVVQEDITARVQAEERIRTLAYFDPLTDLPNRRMLLDRLAQAMAASERNDTFGALLFMDLDHFKTLNDTRGHEVGDELLRQVAQRLKLHTRGEDTVARLGGDEFVVLLSDMGKNETEAAQLAETVASKLLAELCRDYMLGGLSHHCSASVGVSLFKGASTSVEDLMKHADMAMYRAKAAGRGAVRFFAPELEVAVRARAQMEQELRSAIAGQQFLLHYQPQVVAPGGVFGAEVLVRWQHPQRGLVYPGDFIALMEETDLIVPLGNWVLEQACTQIAAWSLDPAMGRLSLSVNVSAMQFMQADFVEQVQRTLAARGANPQRLKIELTEGILVEDVEVVVDRMQRLKDMGIGFSLDDFGTGYSSLTYLKKLPLGQLKIDRSFVRDVLTDANGAAIAKTIVALGQTLGLDVIAEGVESEQQRDFLDDIGCHAYQGYLFSRPVPLEEFEQMCRAAPATPAWGPEE